MPLTSPEDKLVDFSDSKPGFLSLFSFLLPDALFYHNNLERLCCVAVNAPRHTESVGSSERVEAILQLRDLWLELPLDEQYVTVFRDKPEYIEQVIRRGLLDASSHVNITAANALRSLGLPVVRNVEAEVAEPPTRSKIIPFP